ncbi:MAG: glycosyltransferase [Bacteroidia bacterium]|nr:glycosyltransferase [Bacteroidia bacterium]
MKITVCISTYNRPDSLRETLTHLVGTQTLPLEDYQVVVINDGTTDLGPVVAPFAHADVQLVPNRGKGLAAGRNTGVAHAKYPLILLLDDDILAAPDHLQRHIEVHQRFPRALCTANRFDSPALLEAGAKTPFGRYKLKRDYRWEVVWAKTPLDDRFVSIESLAGFSCSFTRESYEAIGPFDERFPFAGIEDQDFFERAKALGYEMIFDTANACYHNEVFNLDRRKWLARQYTGAQGYILLWNKYPEKKTNNPFLAAHAPPKPGDSLALRLKKLRYSLLGTTLAWWGLLALERLFGLLAASDRLYERLYNAMYIHHAHRGFRKGLRQFGDGTTPAQG